MSDDLHTLHTSTPEFYEALEREMLGAFRRQRQFPAEPHSERGRRLRAVLASAAGTVFVLAIGLVLGTSTGYASARVESDRQRDEIATNTLGVTSQLAVLRLDLERARSDLAQRGSGKGAVSQAALQAAAAELRAMAASVERIELDLAQNRTHAASTSVVAPRRLPVTRALAATCTALALCADSAIVQQTVPTITLPPASARTSEALWDVAGIRQVAGGKLLVNDWGARQIRLFDSTLTTSLVTVDAAGIANGYGAKRLRPIQLNAYLGDSSLLPDPSSQTIRILDGAGRIARTVSFPNAGLNLAERSYADDKGRVLFAGRADWALRTGDSLPILRLDLASARVDTVGRVKNTSRFDVLADSTTNAPNPVWLGAGMNSVTSLVPGRDDWAVLSDGSIAFIRGHDYHIDWVRADGTKYSSPKLPFDWQGLADESKRQLGDTARIAGRNLRLAIGSRAGDTASVNVNKVYAAKTSLYNLTISLTQGSAGAVLPDLDGNVWVLPTAVPMRMANADLVYDVVNAKGELFQRVRVPAGRSIAGFGKGGVVYLVSGDRPNGFYLERTRFVAAPR